MSRVLQWHRLVFRCHQTTHIDSSPAKMAKSGRKSASSAGTSVAEREGEQQQLTVCSITGDWGAYQWSLCLFSTLYSGLASLIVVFGPMLTPELSFTCAAWADQSAPHNQSNSFGPSAAQEEDGGRSDQCFKIIGEPSERLECAAFKYDDQLVGAMLTNSFDLVCDRRWLRSLVSSASLVGMLISSVTLGLFSDKFGRLRCIQSAYAISCLANVVAIFTHDYYLFCVCVMLMSYSQVGAANALCTLMMEATSPRFRFIPVFEYGIGWGLGVMLVPAVHYLTNDYRYFMLVVLGWQLLMTPWLHWGVFESIRWLLSEGHFNRAQIELRRACQMNGVKANAQLAQNIAHLQTQQVRKASRIIEAQMAPVHLAKALGARVDETARELDLLSDAIRKSFFGDETAEDGADAQQPPHQRRATSSHLSSSQMQSIDLTASLSPTLSRMSFSVSAPVLAPPTGTGEQPASSLVSAPVGVQSGAAQVVSTTKPRQQLDAIMSPDNERRDSFTTQGLIQLALKYSKTVQRSDEGQFFLIQMFHRKLWRNTAILLFISIMYETTYYGFIQAGKFVGKSVALNYVLGGLGEWVAAVVSMLMLAKCSRKSSLIVTTLLGSLVCLLMALSYQLAPDTPTELRVSATPTSLLEVENSTQLLAITTTTAATVTTTLGPPPLDGGDKLINNENHLEPTSLLLIDDAIKRDNESAIRDELHLQVHELERLIELRHKINVYLMNIGKLVICVGIQVAATIAMEVYPNNLRQTASGAIVLVGRLGSILAPFLFNDPSDDKHVLKLTLVSLALIGMLVCVFVPVTIVDNKGKELCDQMDEI